MTKALLILFVLWHAVASLAALILYALDKRRSVRGGRRVRERTLHIVGLLGGWPGALLARRALRHKTVKRPFVRVFWLGVAAHCGVVGLLVWVWIGRG